MTLRKSLCGTAITMVAFTLASQETHGALTNLYTFNGNSVTDSVGGQNGTLVNGAILSGGMADLTSTNGLSPNGGGAYISLPGGVASSAATGGTAGQFSFSVWITVQENRDWAAAVSFGNSNGSDGGSGDYLQLIPRAGNGGNTLRLTSHQAGNGTEGFVNGPSTATIATPINIIGVFNQSGGVPGTLELFVDGVSAGSAAMAPIDISSPAFDTNAWLGRSAWNDSGFDGMYDEFAIYDTALSASEAAAVFAAGPTPVPEPSALALATGLAAISFRRRRK